MNKEINKIFGWIIILIFIGALAYFFRTNLLIFKNLFYQQYFPCQQPITYRLGDFDQDFGISQKAFLATIAEAEQIWEKPSGLNLFEYSPSGSLKINLIYDYRQDTTIKLSQLDVEVKEDQATYNKLKQKYLSLEKSYLADKKILDVQVAELAYLTTIYNTEIEKLNRKGRAPATEIEKLNNEETKINQIVTQLKTQQSALNEKVAELNTLSNTLNRLAKNLNLSVDHYNTIGASRGSEFEEGTYLSSISGQEINIYQFENTLKLVRVLAHELGHALNLEHVSSTKAIMYYLNNGVNDKLLPDDLLEIKKHCRLK